MLGLNLFHGPNQRVEPAPGGNPGYDGSVFFADGSSLMLSIKNHGISSAELWFRKKVAGINEAFLQAAAKHGRNGLMNRIVATAHPGEADWKQLRDQMDGIVAGTDSRLDGVWSGRLLPLPTVYNPLSPQHLSYGFQIAVPYHPNEQNNFYDNIRKGIANLRKHHSVVPDDVCRALLLRLSASASIPKCAEWAKAYFDDMPDTPVELILLYQAVPAANLAAGNTAIMHYMACVPGPKFAKWQAGRAARRFVIRLLVGKLASEPVRQVLTDGIQTTPIDGLYMFQKG